ncbi:MAG: hypothetical protein KC548_02065 [Nanoarchaeota archaeon]|nr:hypothetical protein [Nanoarchaeota archaeon]
MDNTTITQGQQTEGVDEGRRNFLKVGAGVLAAVCLSPSLSYGKISRAPFLSPNNEGELPKIVAYRDAPLKTAARAIVEEFPDFATSILFPKAARPINMPAKPLNRDLYSLDSVPWYLLNQTAALEYPSLYNMAFEENSRIPLPTRESLLDYFAKGLNPRMPRKLQIENLLTAISWAVDNNANLPYIGDADTLTVALYKKSNKVRSFESPVTFSLCLLALRNTGFEQKPLQDFARTLEEQKLAPNYFA